MNPAVEVSLEVATHHQFGDAGNFGVHALPGIAQAGAGYCPDLSRGHGRQRAILPGESEPTGSANGPRRTRERSSPDWRRIDGGNCAGDRVAPYDHDRSLECQWRFVVNDLVLSRRRSGISWR